MLPSWLLTPPAGRDSEVGLYYKREPPGWKPMLADEKVATALDPSGTLIPSVEIFRPGQTWRVMISSSDTSTYDPRWAPTDHPATKPKSDSFYDYRFYTVFLPKRILESDPHTPVDVHVFFSATKERDGGSVRIHGLRAAFDDSGFV